MIISIVNQLDPNCRDFQTLRRLVFSVYLWHIWREWNVRIFQNKSSPPQDILHTILNKFQSKITFLGLSLPERESSCLHLLQRHQIRRFVRKLMCQIIDVFLYHLCTLFWLGSIFWRDKETPQVGLIQSDGDFYSDIIQLLRLIHQDVFSISIEGNSGLLKVLKVVPNPFGWSGLRLWRWDVFFKDFLSSMRFLIFRSGFLGGWRVQTKSRNELLGWS